MIRYIFYLHRKAKRSTIQIYYGVCLKMPCTRFDALCFQLVQESYTKSELLVIMRLLESNIDEHGRKTYAPIFKGKHLIGLTVTNPWVDWDQWDHILASTQKKIWWKKRMCATWKFELKKHRCEKRGQLLKKISKYQNIKISK